MENERYIRRVDFSNKAKRVPVCFCIDTSHSMGFIDPKLGGYRVVNPGKTVYVDQTVAGYVEGGTTYIEEVMDGIKKFYEAILDDDIACDACECAIVTFNDSPKLYEGFDTVDNKTVPDLSNEPKGNTNVTPALEMCLDLLEKQKQFYKSNRIGYYQPWLVVFSDGLATDDVSRIQYRLMNLQDNEKLTVYTMALSDDVELLNHLSGYSKKRPIVCKDASTIKKFFDFLAKSVSITAGDGTPDDFEF